MMRALDCDTLPTTRNRRSFAQRLLPVRFGSGFADKTLFPFSTAATAQITFPDPTRLGLGGFGRVVAHPEVINVTRSCLLDSKGDNMLEDHVSVKGGVKVGQCGGVKGSQ